MLTPQLTRIAQGPGGNVLLTWHGAFRCNLSPPYLNQHFLPIASWTSLTTGAFDANGQFSVTDTTAATARSRFYRISTP
ncbi:MAG TPA: hypothetical protein VNU68_29595 [Verrucomicrobiae bacterium]|nr:hypothetical protein [Verrucomicrobiae bacterium]